MTQPSPIREPAVAGWFYPGEADELAATVDRLLGDASAPSHPPVHALIAPHAGYAYSGAIAGRGFARLRGHGAPARAFVIGPSHVEAFGYTSVFDGDAYRTPLGAVSIDRDAAQGLARGATSIRLSRAGHDPPRRGRGEHAIEVELPFLQRCFETTRLVAIVMGDQSWEACEELGRAIAAAVHRDRDVVIASSDLSHFHDAATARSLDTVFCDALLTLDARDLHDRVRRGQCEACGAGPVVAALIATAALRNRVCEVVAAGNSGDVSGDRDSVVGYASAVVSGDAA